MRRIRSLTHAPTRLARQLVALLAPTLALLACGEAPGDAPATDAGTDGPGTAYTVPAGPRALLFELKGLINPYDHVLHQEKATLGSGAFHVVASGKQVELMDEDLLMYSYLYGNSAGARAGKRLLVVHALRIDPASTTAVYHLGVAQVIVPWEALAGQGDGAPLELDAVAAGVRVTVRRVTVAQRSDGVSLSRDCTTGVLDPQSGASRVRIVRPGGKTGLAEGQPLFIRGNLALEQDPQRLSALLAGKGLELHRGEHCYCSKDDKPVACALYETEVKKSGEELSCPLPAGFLAPAAKSSVALTFKGPINASGAATTTAALATLSATVDGKVYPLGYRSHAVRYTSTSGAWNGKEIVELLSMGDVKTVASSRYTFNVLMTRVRADLLAAIKAGGGHRPPTGAPAGGLPEYLAYLFAAEQIYPESGDNLVRLCPVAITTSAPGDLYLCHAQNTSFAVGETLELAANLELTGDPQQIAAWLGLSAGECYCTKNGASMSCSAFPAK